jgi:hypothetical protein
MIIIIIIIILGRVPLFLISRIIINIISLLLMFIHAHDLAAGPDSEEKSDLHSVFQVVLLLIRLLYIII